MAVFNNQKLKYRQPTRQKMFRKIPKNVYRAVLYCTGTGNDEFQKSSDYNSTTFYVFLMSLQCNEIIQVQASKQRYGTLTVWYRSVHWKFLPSSRTVRYHIGTSTGTAQLVKNNTKSKLRNCLNIQGMTILNARIELIFFHDV